MDHLPPPSPIKDPKRIDLADPAEVAAWCEQLKIAPDDLKTAVDVVGPMSAAVSVYVNSRGRRGTMRQIGEMGQPFARLDQPAPATAATRSDAE